MDVEKAGMVQMRVTRMHKQLKKTAGMKIGLDSDFLINVHYRRLRGLMIQVYNIISGVHDSYSSIQFNISNISNTKNISI